MKRRPRAAVRRRVIKCPRRRAGRSGREISEFPAAACRKWKIPAQSCGRRPFSLHKTVQPPQNHANLLIFRARARRRPLPHRYPIPAPASPCRARAFPRRDRPNSAAALPNRYPETPPRLARQGKSIFLRGYDNDQNGSFLHKTVRKWQKLKSFATI